MASAYSTIMRHIDEWQWGPVILLAFEINPRSGPPDFSIDVTKEGHWSLIPCPCDDWQPSERDETEFALFLVTRQGDILLGGIYSRSEAGIREEVERCRHQFASLAGCDIDPRSSPRG